MRATWLILAALLLVTPASAGRGLGVEATAGVAPSAATDGLAHPSIAIQGDTGFAGPFSGVVRGAGTASDPYVVSGWTIVHSGEAAIRIADTTAHVVVERIEILGSEAAAFEAPACADDGICFGSVGIEIVHASHVTIRDVRVADDDVGIQILGGSSDVTVDRARLDPVARVRPPEPSWPGSIGVRAIDAAGVSMSNVTVSGRDAPFLLLRTQDTTLRDSSIVASPLGSAIALTDTTRTSIVANEIQGGGIRASGTQRDLVVARNSFVGGPAALQQLLSATAALEGGDFCGNTATGTSGPEAALYLFQARNVSIRGNSFEDNANAIKIQQSANVAVERNAVRGSSGRALHLLADGATIRMNSFDDNADGVWIFRNATATDNWWGDASGPSFIQPGTGDALHVSATATVPYAPWLLAPEPTVVDCGVDARTVAPPVALAAQAAGGFAAHATLKVDAPALRVRIELDAARSVGTGPIALP